MYLDRFLTEYDDSLSSELNVDPLGLLVIWSAFGQAIFHNRVNSISNDVRNYTINLFHHYVLKTLVEDDGVVLGSAMKSKYASKDELKFKHACLIYLENLYVYSMIDGQSAKGVDTTGVLGTSNARRRWNESGENPSLKFGHGSDSQVLVRQPFLGISGRYKTPLMEMSFFDKQYRYDSPQGTESWLQAAALVESAPVLKKLYEHLRNHMIELLGKKRKRELVFSYDDIDSKLPLAYVNAFASPAWVGSYAGDFWLGLTELDKGSAGALYAVLKSIKSSDRFYQLPVPQLFNQARNQLPAVQTTEIAKLDHVLVLEPFLTELDLMFTLMLASKEQKLTDAVSVWKKMGRNEKTLPSHARSVIDDSSLMQRLSRTGRNRLQQLLRIVELGTIAEQIQLLLDYHTRVMSGRGQLPWVKLSDTKLKIDVSPRKSPDLDRRTADYWANSYYIPQFRNLLRGLWGMAS